MTHSNLWTRNAKSDLLLSVARCYGPYWHPQYPRYHADDRECTSIFGFLKSLTNLHGWQVFKEEKAAMERRRLERSTSAPTPTAFPNATSTTPPPVPLPTAHEPATPLTDKSAQSSPPIYAPKPQVSIPASFLDPSASDQEFPFVADDHGLDNVPSSRRS